MATITVVAPRVVYPGADGHFENFTEANSTSLAAGRLVFIDGSNTSGRWTPTVSDGVTILGQNVVAGVNATTGLTATPIFIFNTNTVIEINTNSSGTDPLLYTGYSTVVSTNDHQLDTTDVANNRLTPLRLSPKDTTGDTNIRVWARLNPANLQGHVGS